MLILILTPISKEFAQVRKHLVSPTVISKGGMFYEQGKFEGKFHSFDIVLRQTGSKNNDIALAAERAISSFNPSIVILTGIAGGVKDVQIGDVVIANKLYGYDSGNETSEGFKSRPEVVSCSIDLVDFANTIAKKSDWKERSKYATDKRVFIGPIASGDKIIRSKKSPIYLRIKTHFNDTLALEMEAIGFAKALLYHPSIKFINIRGVSDLLDDKSHTDSKGGQEVAIANASAFVFEMLFHLNYKNLLPMDANSITNTILSIFSSFLKKSKSVEKISSEITEASDTTISSIWKKIKPIFIEEFEEKEGGLKPSVENKDVVAHVLESKISKDNSLKNELTELIKAVEKSDKAKEFIEKHNQVNVTGNHNTTLTDVTIGGNFNK